MSHDSSVVSVLAASTAQQAEAMVKIADLSAQSLRAATGTYVFQLRDRFDDAFPVPQIGVAGSSWDGGPDAPGPLEVLVLHHGDVVQATVTLVCNQAPLRRHLRVELDGCDSAVALDGVSFTASALQAQRGWEYWAPQDLSVFIDVPVTVDIAGLGVIDEHGMLLRSQFEQHVALRLVITDTRPEGAVATFPITLRLSGAGVPEEDGVGLDLLSAEAHIGVEQRAYFLDKQARVPLTLPVGSDSSA